MLLKYTLSAAQSATGRLPATITKDGKALFSATCFFLHVRRCIQPCLPVEPTLRFCAVLLQVNIAGVGFRYRPGKHNAAIEFRLPAWRERKRLVFRFPKPSPPGKHRWGR